VSEYRKRETDMPMASESCVYQGLKKMINAAKQKAVVAIYNLQGSLR
jgi:hypothetical protein